MVAPNMKRNGQPAGKAAAAKHERASSTGTYRVRQGAYDKPFVLPDFQSPFQCSGPVAAKVRTPETDPQHGLDLLHRLTDSFGREVQDLLAGAVAEKVSHVSYPEGRNDHKSYDPLCSDHCGTLCGCLKGTARWPSLGSLPNYGQLPGAWQQSTGNTGNADGKRDVATP
jgi:hypothetical protein